MQNRMTACSAKNNNNVEAPLAYYSTPIRQPHKPRQVERPVRSALIMHEKVTQVG
jgi:hypothetical protein